MKIDGPTIGVAGSILFALMIVGWAFSVSFFFGGIVLAIFMIIVGVLAP